MKIKDDTIIEQLQRFMDGATSLEEEARLARFFRHATDGDKPAAISDADWQAYKEMFRQFEEGFDSVPAQPERRKTRILPLWTAAAAVIIAVLSVTLLMSRGHDTTPLTAAITTADSIAADTVRIINVETIHQNIMPEKPERPVKPQRQKRLPYTPPVPRRLMAQAEGSAMTREDSIAMAVKEAEAVMEAMTIYQELKISEICNVEYIEEY